MAQRTVLSSLLLELASHCAVLFLVQTVLADVVHDLGGHKIVDIHAPLRQKSDSSRGHVVGDCLGDVVDVVLPLLETSHSFLEIGTCSLNDESAVLAKDVGQILLTPDSGGTHSLDQVCASEEGDAHGVLDAIRVLYASDLLIQLMLEMI